MFCRHVHCANLASDWFEKVCMLIVEVCGATYPGILIGRLCHTFWLSHDYGCTEGSLHHLWNTAVSPCAQNYIVA